MAEIDHHLFGGLRPDFELMKMEHLKRPEADMEAEDCKIHEAVETIIDRIRSRGEDAVRTYAREFDG